MKVNIIDLNGIPIFHTDNPKFDHGNYFFTTFQEVKSNYQHHKVFNTPCEKFGNFISPKTSYQNDSYAISFLHNENNLQDISFLLVACFSNISVDIMARNADANKFSPFQWYMHIFFSKCLNLVPNSSPLDQHFLLHCTQKIYKDKATNNLRNYIYISWEDNSTQH